MSTYDKKIEELFSDDLESQYRPKFVDFEALEHNVVDVLAKNLTASRKALGLSQSRMAKIFGVSLAQYKKYESGMEFIKVDAAQRWSLWFGIPAYHLIKGSNYNIPSNNLEDKLNFKWFLANSLTNEYFSKLIEIVRLFSTEQYASKAPDIRPINKSDVSEALDELDKTMYISIAKGLRAFRERFDISQDIMAEYLGVSKSTYQQYEKETMKPRFSFLVAARFYTSTGINPLGLIRESKYSKVRFMQEERMKILLDIAKNISTEKIDQLRPLVNGFFDMVKTSPGSMLIDH